MSDMGRNGVGARGCGRNRRGAGWFRMQGDVLDTPEVLVREDATPGIGAGDTQLV
jgi:hypothetical protein